AENNNRLIELKRYLHTFPPEVYRFFEIQTKAIQGTATAEERAWMKAQISKPEFVSKLMTFGNFVHGTHVAGIATQGADAAKTMVLKLIPTEAPKPFANLGQAIESIQRIPGVNPTKEKLLLAGLSLLAQQQGKVFGPISRYLKMEKAQVANCSFGTS